MAVRSIFSKSSLLRLRLTCMRIVVPPLAYDPNKLPEAFEKFAEQFIGKL